MCGVSKLLGCARACKSGLVLNGSSLMTGKVGFVAMCVCSDINVSNLHRLCTAHSCVSYIAYGAVRVKWNL